jgi:hypothetical protein
MSTVIQLTPFGGVVLTGTTVPATTDGVIGNLYIRNTSGIYDIYGPKTDSGWGTPVSLIGPANSLSIGTVTTGTPAAATITGTPPNQTLHLTIPQGPPGGLTARQTTTVTTSSINAGATWTGTVSLAPAFILLKLGLDFPGWLRVYPTATDMTNDSTRLQNEDPDVTVTAEIATSGNQELAPYRSGVIGSNLETPFTNTQFISLRNLDSVPRTFTITFRWVALEA